MGMNKVNNFSDFYIPLQQTSDSVNRQEQKQFDFQKKPCLDAFIKENAKQIQKENKSSGYFHTLFRSFTMGIPVCMIAGYETVKSIKLYRYLKKMSPAQRALDGHILKNKFLKELILLYAGVLGITYGVYKYGLATKDKYLEREQKKIDKFNIEHKSNIKFKPLKNVSDSALGAMNPMAGILTVDETLAIDPIMRQTYLPVVINHELVHAKQYLLIARLENAMERMNMLAFKKIAKGADYLQKFTINNLKKEIDSGISDKYKDAKIEIDGVQMKLVDFVNAMYTAINKPDFTEKDIPLLVNKEFYENAKKLGPLSEEEKKKALEYFKAYENYPLKVGLFRYSEYKNNLLEKEAFADAPWYYF